MAIVRLTKECNNAILNNIELKFAPPLQAIRNEIESGMKAEIYNEYMPQKYVDLAMQLPKGCIVTNNNFYFQYKTADGYDFRYTLSFPTKMLCNDTGTHLYAPVELQMTEPLAGKFKALVDKYVALDRQKTTLIGHINKLLTQCATLQQLVQVWPSALEYVSSKSLEQYNKQVGAKKPKFDPANCVLSPEAKVLLVKTRLT